MQREACHDFVKKRGWIIAEEFVEKGISGYKVSSDNREAMQEIKKAAIRKAFDVLLVFMFDRLGRRDDETPFVVEWFVKNGIEVWSVVEGEQRFEDHIDKLLNYIRYWQSSGESLKTSIRTKTRMEQLTKEGLFVGGTPPYGYKLCKLGRINKRGFEVHDVLVDTREAAVVRMVFDLYCSGKMGTYQIAQYLSKQGIPARSGRPWRSASVGNILRNDSYTGVRKFGEAKSEILPHLQIIDIETFSLARKQAGKNKSIKPSKSRAEYISTVLFTNIVYCMHCGKKMAVERKKKFHKSKYGEKIPIYYLKYSCINRNENPRCDGQRMYSAKIIDEQMSVVISKFLSEDTAEKIHELVKTPSHATDKINDLEYALKSEKNTISDLKGEVINVIRGTSAFGSILLNDLILKSENRIEYLENEIVIEHDRQLMQKFQKDRFHEICKKINDESGIVLASLPFSAQKNAVHQLIERLYLGRGYKYRIDWKFGGCTQGEFETEQVYH